MVNNDVLKKLRFILDFNDQKMVEVLSLGHLVATTSQVKAWLLKDDADGYIECNDSTLSSFLNGLIIEKRGVKEGAGPKVEEELSNNIILKKLMIAFSLKSDDVIALLKLADLRVGKSELSAFFRKSDHRNYRVCKSQVLRNFLMGLQLKLKSSTIKCK